jgi:hypothetical protein
LLVSVWVEVSDGIEERVVFLCELFELPDEPAFAQAPMMLELPDDEPRERFASREPLLSGCWYPVVIGDKDPFLLSGVREEDGVECPFRKDVDSSLDIPSSLNEPVNELLSNVIISEKREPRH